MDRRISERNGCGPTLCLLRPLPSFKHLGELREERRGMGAGTVLSSSQGGRWEPSTGSLQVRKSGLFSSRLEKQKQPVASGQRSLLFRNFSGKTDTNMSCGSQHRERLGEAGVGWILGRIEGNACKEGVGSRPSPGSQTARAPGHAGSPSLPYICLHRGPSSNQDGQPGVSEDMELNRPPSSSGTEGSVLPPGLSWGRKETLNTWKENGSSIVPWRPCTSLRGPGRQGLAQLT